MRNFYVLTMTGTQTPGNAVLAANAAMGVKSFELRRGIPLKPRFRAGLTFRFDDDFPEGRQLTDLISVSWAGFPVSKRLREILAVEPKVEFLPITVADHRGKTVAEDYQLANFLEPLDAADMAQSQAVENALEPGRYRPFRKLVLVEGNIPADRHAFRLAQRTETVIVDDAIAGPVARAKLTGIACVPVDRYSGVRSPIGS